MKLPQTEIIITSNAVNEIEKQATTYSEKQISIEIQPRQKNSLCKNVTILTIVFFAIACLLLACKISFQFNQSLNSESIQTGTSVPSLRSDSNGLSNIWIENSRQKKNPDRRLAGSFPFIPTFEAFKNNPKYYLAEMKSNRANLKNTKLNSKNRKGSVSLYRGNQPVFEPTQHFQKKQENKKAQKKLDNFVRFGTPVFVKKNKDVHSGKINFANVSPWRLNMGFGQVNKLAVRGVVKAPVNLKFGHTLKR